MQVSVETTNGLERRMTVGIPKEKIDSAVQTRLKSLAGKAKIDGFRPGKVPFKVIEKRYGHQVQNEVIGELMQNTFYEAVSKENLRPAGMPHIEPGESSSEGGMQMIATFEIYPDIELQPVENVTVEKPVLELGESDIDAMIETIRKQRVSWKEADRKAQKGDKVTVDFEGKIDGVVFDGGSGKGMSVELGAGRMIPGFEDQLEGVSPGDEKTLSMNFPEQYHNQEVAGKPVTFEVKVTKVETPELPELNEAFVTSMGVADGSLEAFREQVKANMEREAAQSITGKVKRQALDGLLDNNQFDVPKVLVDSEIQALVQQQQQQLGEQAVKELDPVIFEEQARRRVALGLILTEIVKQNELKVTPAKVRSVVEDMAAGYEHPDEVLKYYYSDRQRLAEIENYVLEGEVVDWVVSKASVTEKPVSFNELVAPAQA